MRVRFLEKESVFIEEMKFPISETLLCDIINSPLGDEITHANVTVFGCDGLTGCELYLENVDLANLNKLAEKIDAFDEERKSRFIGGCNILGKERLLNITEIHNIAENVIQDKSFTHFPARDSKELADFYLDNGLIEEINGMDFASYEWVVEKLDLEKVGESIEESLDGEFVYTSLGCVVLSGEIEDLYQEPLDDQEQGMGGIGC